MVERYKIIWTPTALSQFKILIEYISKDSPQNANKVRLDILDTIERISINPEFYQPDKYKENNDISFRAFEKHHYRITYKFSKSNIRILRVRHTSMKPKSY